MTHEYPDYRFNQEREMEEDYKQIHGEYPTHPVSDDKPIKYPMTPWEKLVADKKRNGVDDSSIDNISARHLLLRELNNNPYTT